MQVTIFTVAALALPYNRHNFRKSNVYTGFSVPNFVGNLDGKFSGPNIGGDIGFSGANDGSGLYGESNGSNIFITALNIISYSSTEMVNILWKLQKYTVYNNIVSFKLLYFTKCFFLTRLMRGLYFNNGLSNQKLMKTLYQRIAKLFIAHRNLI